MVINPNLEQVADRAKETGRSQSVIRRIKDRYRSYSVRTAKYKNGTKSLRSYQICFGPPYVVDSGSSH